MSWRLFIFIVILVLVLWRYGGDWSPRTPGVVAPDAPTQTTLAPAQATPWTDGDYKITPLAGYSIKARVLHVEPYWLDIYAKLSPRDFALGWQRMSDPAIYDKLSVSQGGRWYNYQWSGEPPIPEDEIIRESANTHLIPADAEVRSQIERCNAGDIVQLSGYIVHVDGPHGLTWQSSLSRTDTGNGACEVMWVKEAKRLGR